MKAEVLASYNATFVMKVERMAEMGETIQATDVRFEHGGKGSNQAVGISRLGAEVRLIAGVGRDPFGESALSLWASSGMDVSGVKRSRVATGMAFVFVVGTQNFIYISPGANSDIDQDWVGTHLGEADVFMTVFEVPSDLALWAARHAARASLTFVNPAPAHAIMPDELDGIYAITPNEAEIKVMAGLSPVSDVDFRELARSYAKHVNVVAVTLGEKGSYLVSGSSEKHIYPLPSRAKETTGAGDSWSAAFAYFIAKGEGVFDAAEMANAAASLLVERRRGEALVDNLPTLDEVEHRHSGFMRTVKSLSRERSCCLVPFRRYSATQGKRLQEQLRSWERSTRVTGSPFTIGGKTASSDLFLFPRPNAS
ncbi:MAG: ribokinase [Thermoprotei archaeon]